MRLTKRRKQNIVRSFYNDIGKKYPQGLYGFIEAKHPSLEHRMQSCEERINVLVNHPKSNINQLKKELSTMYGLLDRGQRMFSLTIGTIF